MAPEVAIELPPYTARNSSTVSNVDRAASDSCSEAPLVGISPGEGILVIGVGGGCGEPRVGISPASAVAERTHAKAEATKSRFMSFLLEV
jgi:hypothetical protein